MIHLRPMDDVKKPPSHWRHPWRLSTDALVEAVTERPGSRYSIIPLFAFLQNEPWGRGSEAVSLQPSVFIAHAQGLLLTAEADG